jgi:hypothetical protein
VISGNSAPMMCVGRAATGDERETFEPPSELSREIDLPQRTKLSISRGRWCPPSFRRRVDLDFHLRKPSGRPGTRSCRNCCWGHVFRQLQTIEQELFLPAHHHVMSERVIKHVARDS